MRILVVVPVGTDRRNRERKAICERYASPGTEIGVVSLPRGPLSLETRRDHDEAIPLIIETSMRASDGYDAVIVSCFLDPAVPELRRALRGKVVVGPGETSLFLARLLGEAVTVLTVGLYADTVEMIAEHVERLGLKGFVEVRGIPYGVLDADRDKDTALELLIKESIKAKERGRDVIVIGCTTLAGLAEKVQEAVGLPVIDPLRASILLAETLVRLRK